MASSSMDADDFSLTLSIYRHESSYLLELNHRDPQSQALVMPLRSTVSFDLPALLAAEASEANYGETLALQLFANNQLKQRFLQVETAAQARGARLRLLLSIDPSAQELQALRWELLHHPETGRRLTTSENLLLSRFMVSRDFRPVRQRPSAGLRALIVVSAPAPAKLASMKLATVDFEAEVRAVRPAFNEGPDSVKVEVLGGPDFPVTIEAVLTALRKGVDLVYLVSHGMFGRNNNSPALVFQDNTGEAKVIKGEDLTERIADLEHKPRLMILASCQSAGDGQQLHPEQRTTAQATLAGRLADAGVPALVAMQGFITMATVVAMMPTFITELLRDGRIDRALAVARGAVRERPDSWMPALYIRLMDGRLWSETGITGGGGILVDHPSQEWLLSAATHAVRSLLAQAHAARASGDFHRAHDMYEQAHIHASELAADGASATLEVLAATQMEYAISLIQIGSEQDAIEHFGVVVKLTSEHPQVLSKGQQERLVRILAQIRQPILVQHVLSVWDSIPPTLEILLAIERGEIPQELPTDSFLRSRIALAHERKGDFAKSASIVIAILEAGALDSADLANAILILGRAIFHTAIHPREVTSVIELNQRVSALKQFAGGLARLRAEFAAMPPSTKQSINEIAADVQRCTFDRHGLEQTLLQMGIPVTPSSVWTLATYDGDDWQDDYEQFKRSIAEDQTGEGVVAAAIELARVHSSISVVQWVVAQHLARLGRTSEALSFAEAAFELMPGVGQAMFLGEVLINNQRQSEAWLIIEPFLELESSDPMLFRCAAWALRRSEPLKSCRFFKQYVEAASDTPVEDVLAFAETLAQVGSEEEAVKRVRQVLLTSGPDVDPRVLFGVSNILSRLAPLDERTKEELREIHQRLSANYAPEPTIEQFKLKIFLELGSPTDLERPDYERLVEDGVMARVPVDDAVEWMRAQFQRRASAWSAWRVGTLSFSAFRDAAEVETAEILERLTTQSITEPILVPLFLKPRIRGEVYELDGKTLLLGDLEVGLLLELGVWAATLEQLGDEGRVAVFEDVWNDHVQTATERLRQCVDRFALDRESRLLDLIDRSRKVVCIPEPALEKPALVAVVGGRARGGDAWSIAELVATLASAGWLTRDEAALLSAGSELARGRVPSLLSLDHSALEELWQADLLRQVLECQDIEQVEVASVAREQIIARVQELKLLARAADRAMETRQAMIQAQDAGRLVIVARPIVDMPPAVSQDWAVFRRISLDLFSWRRFLVDHPEAMLLSADHATSAGSIRAPVGLAQTLAWSSPKHLEQTIFEYRGVGERVVGFAELVEQVASGSEKFEVSIRLAEFGLGGAISPAQILELARRYGRMSGARPRRILDIYEWAARTGLDSIASTQVHVCKNYADTVWYAWCGDGADLSPLQDVELREDLTRELAGRVARLAPEVACELNRRFFSWILITAVSTPVYSMVDEAGLPYFARGRSYSDRFFFDEASPAGQLWAWLRAWVSEHEARSRAWNMAVQNTVAFCALETKSIHFARFGVASLALAVRIVSTLDPLRLNQPPANYVVLLAFTCEAPLKVLAIHQFGLSDMGPASAWSDVLSAVAANGDPSNLLACSADLRINEIDVSVQAEYHIAVLLHDPSPERTRGLIEWALAMANHDARVARAAVRLAQTSDDPLAAQSAFVRAAAESPWSVRDDDPLGPAAWGLGADITFPRSLVDIEQLLGEDISDEDEISQRLMSQRIRIPGFLCLLPLREPGSISGDTVRWAHEILSDVIDYEAVDCMVSAAVSTYSAAVDPPTTGEDGQFKVADLLARALLSEHAAQFEHADPEHETPSMAKLEWHLLGLCKQIIVRMERPDSRELSPERVVYLAWRLFQWWWWRLANTPEPQRSAALRHLLCIGAPSNLANAARGIVLDPDRFGPGRWNHRLASLLCGAIFGYTLARSRGTAFRNDALASEILEAELVTLSQCKATQAELDVRYLGDHDSPLHWRGGTVISDLALELLLRTQPGSLRRMSNRRRMSILRRAFVGGRWRLPKWLKQAVVLAAWRDGFAADLMMGIALSARARRPGTTLRYTTPVYRTRRYVTRSYPKNHYHIGRRQG